MVIFVEPRAGASVCLITTRSATAHKATSTTAGIAIPNATTSAEEARSLLPRTGRPSRWGRSPDSAMRQSAPTKTAVPMASIPHHNVVIAWAGLAFGLSVDWPLSPQPEMKSVAAASSQYRTRGFYPAHVGANPPALSMHGRRGGTWRDRGQSSGDGHD